MDLIHKNQGFYYDTREVKIMEFQKYISSKTQLIHIILTVLLPFPYSQRLANGKVFWNGKKCQNPQNTCPKIMRKSV